MSDDPATRSGSTSPAARAAHHQGHPVGDHQRPGGHGGGVPASGDRLGYVDVHRDDGAAPASGPGVGHEADDFCLRECVELQATDLDPGPLPPQSVAAVRARHAPGWRRRRRRMSLIATIGRPSPADGLEMSQSWIVVLLAWRMATPKLSPVAVILSSLTVTFGGLVTSTVPATRVRRRTPSRRRRSRLPHWTRTSRGRWRPGWALSAATPPGGRCRWRPGSHTNEGWRHSRCAGDRASRPRPRRRWHALGTGAASRRWASAAGRAASLGRCPAAADLTHG